MMIVTRNQGGVEEEKPVRIYSTCPQSKDIESSRYLQAVADVSRWSEAAGCEGILVYTDNGIVDPWLVSQVVLENTQRLKPLVAIQPVYMHPFSAAKMVASLAFIYGRSMVLNMLAGGFKNDLLALGDETPHDERYERTVEYTQILMGLLRGGAPVTVDGRYYRVTNLRMMPAIPPELVPEVLISGSSPAGAAAARALGATAVKYPKPPGEEEDWISGDDVSGSFGVRVGIIARRNADEAWRIAHDRFPEDRHGQITHRVAIAVSDSHWHKQLSEHRDEAADPMDDEPDPYWLGPFQNYKTFCPYLVGSYDRVGQLLAHYVAVGSRTFILDIPASEEELEHIGIVFDRAQQQANA
jgi:alkanesulfonate monooxygenase